MSKNYALEASPRDRAGKGVARALRRENKTPAVIYGDGKDPVKIALDSNIINVEYNRGHMFTTLCDMNIGNDKHLVLARDIQLHPVTDGVMHVDFLRVTPKTKIAVNVPVEFINEKDSPGMQEKGVLNVVRFEIELVCAATAIPDVIEVDMTGKEHGDTITVSDAKLPEGAKPVIDDRDFTIAVLNAPKTMEQLEAELELDADEGLPAEDVEEKAEGAEGGEKAEGEGAEGGEEKKEEGGE